MSTLDEKMERTQEVVHTRARRRLHTLTDAWGYTVLERSGKLPTRVSISPMGMKSTWVRVWGGPSDKSDPWFERESD